MSDQTKLLFTDIDGTLLRSDQTISDALAADLSALAENGHGLILASGRPLGSMLKVYSYLESRLSCPFKIAYCMANNGAQIHDLSTGKTVFEKRVPLPLVDKLQDLADSMQIHLQTYTDTHIICSADDDETKSYRKRVILPVLITERLSSALSVPPFKMLALSLQGSEVLMPFRAAVSEQYADYVHCIFSGAGYLEIVEQSVDKGNALRLIAEHLQIPISHTFAAGDSENDLSMILAAGCGFAMKNSSPNVRASVSHVTARDHQEDGLSEVIRLILQ